MIQNAFSSEMEFARYLCLQSAKLLLGYFQNDHLQKSRKKDRTFVTEADVAVDTFIREEIQKNYPQDFIISEELNSFSAHELPKNGWIIDPLDGTTNFILGLAYWGTLITRVEGGYPVLSIQYFPVLNELYQAAQGCAPLLNGDPIQVESKSAPSSISIFSCCSRTFRNYQVTIRYKTRIFGSAGYSLSSVSKGITRIAFEATAKIWDLAAAWILIPQAGGVIGVLQGEEPFPVLPNMDYQTKNYPILAAASKMWFNEGLQNIKPKD
ncbi:MAG: inositol monophosphatase family protein [Anaerolineales bacterium]